MPRTIKVPYILPNGKRILVRVALPEVDIEGRPIRVSVPYPSFETTYRGRPTKFTENTVRSAQIIGKGLASPIVRAAKYANSPKNRERGLRKKGKRTVTVTEYA